MYLSIRITLSGYSDKVCIRLNKRKLVKSRKIIVSFFANWNLSKLRGRRFIWFRRSITHVSGTKFAPKFNLGLTAIERSLPIRRCSARRWRHYRPVRIADSDFASHNVIASTRSSVLRHVARFYDIAACSQPATKRFETCKSISGGANVALTLPNECGALSHIVKP